MVAKMTPELQQEIILAIGLHLQEHGPQNWALVRERWPEYLVGPKQSAEERRFFRLVKKATGGEATPGEIKADGIRRARAATKKHLPAVPSPAAMIAGGRQADEAVNIMHLLGVTLTDIMLIRDNAVITDPETGAVRVKNFVQLDSSIKRRMDAVDKYLDVFQQIYDLQRMRSFYDEIVSIIVDEIQPLEPTVAQRIMERLKALNDRETMTIHADASVS